jgi:Domain of unknown function (DUF4349)
MSATDAVGAERLEALLRGDAPRGPAEARRAAVLSELRSGALQAPERLRARVLAPAPGRRSVALLPPRRLALVLAAAVLLVALGAAAVHGLLRSGGSQPPVAQRELDHGLSLSGGKAVAGSAGAPAGAPTAPTALPGSRLQHVDATLRVQVADTDALSDATRQATRIATSLGGWAQSVDYGTARGGGGSASLDLRIPVARVQTAVVRLSALGTLLSQQLDQQDLQQQLADESARIAQLRRRVAALAKAVADTSLPAAQRVLLRIRLAEARRSLAQSENARKGTLASGASADVALTLTTKPKAGAVVHHRGRAGRMLHSAVDFLAVEGMVAFYALVVLGPVALVAAVAWWLLRERRRREERRLLAA